MENSAVHSLSGPDIEALRNEALLAGAVDPTTLRFRVVEYDRYSGELIGVPIQDITFVDAVEKTARLIASRADSHFCLDPVGYIQ